MERPWRPLRKEGPAWQDPRLFSWFNPPYPKDILFSAVLEGCFLSVSQEFTCFVIG